MTSNAEDVIFGASNTSRVNNLHREFETKEKSFQKVNSIYIICMHDRHHNKFDIFIRQTIVAEVFAVYVLCQNIHHVHAIPMPCILHAGRETSTKFALKTAMLPL